MPTQIKLQTLAILRSKGAGPERAADSELPVFLLFPKDSDQPIMYISKLSAQWPYDFIKSYPFQEYMIDAKAKIKCINMGDILKEARELMHKKQVAEYKGPILSVPLTEDELGSPDTLASSKKPTVKMTYHNWLQIGKKVGWLQ